MRVVNQETQTRRIFRSLSPQPFRDILSSCVPYARVFAGAPAEEETPAPSPSPITGNGIEDEGGDEGISIGAIVGIVAGVLAILGGSGLLLKCGCKEINFNCFNRH